MDPDNSHRRSIQGPWQSGNTVSNFWYSPRLNSCDKDLDNSHRRSIHSMTIGEHCIEFLIFSKTQFLWQGSRQQPLEINTRTMTIGEHCIEFLIFSKTQFLWQGSRQQPSEINTKTMTIGGTLYRIFDIRQDSLWHSELDSLPSHLSSIPALPAFRRALKHHLFLLAYPDSGAKSGKTKPVQSITLRDTQPATAIAQLGNAMPPI